MNRDRTSIFNKYDPKKAAAWIFCLICAVLEVYLLIRYALGIVMPFLIAFILAAVTHRPAAALSRRTRLPRKLWAVILLTAILASAASLIFWGVGRLLYEGENLLSHIASDSAKLGSTIADIFDRISSIGDRKIPLIENLLKIEAFREFWEELDSILARVISDTVASVTGKLPRALFSIVVSLPGYFVFVVVTLIASFYFCLDYDKIKSFAISALPSGISEKLPIIKKRLGDAAAKYARAYLLLLLLTFLQLFVGFTLLRVQYPFLLAFLVALVDFLPILGVGTVLIPWGLFELIFSKNIFLGVGLLVLYIIVTVIRQITEPKVVAESLGLHPLITLASMYAGLRLFGVFGMILAPLAASALRALFFGGIDKSREI